jgi:CBS domain containing-hemolysin-like protein
MSVPADLPISELVDRFQDERQEMAVVEDEDGTVVGLVTSTDALEAIIGELRDPFDEGA